MSTEAETYAPEVKAEPTATEFYGSDSRRSPELDRERGDRRSRSRSPVREERREERGRPSGGAGNNPGNNLHVSGLSTRVEDRDLDEVFSKYGRIQKCQVMRDPHTKDSRGFAFVTMETGEEAEAAAAGLNATELMGRTMNVEKARRGRARTPTPGQYHGPPKKEDNGGYRAYEPSRSGGGGYGGGYSSRDDYRGSRDSYSGGGRDRYDDRSSGGYAIPMRGGDDRRSDRRDDGRRDDRRPAYDDRRSEPRYDDRRGGDSRGSGGYSERRY